MKHYAPLPDPPFVEPGPECACKGVATQMREHSRTSCSVLRVWELNEITRFVIYGDADAGDVWDRMFGGG